MTTQIPHGRAEPRLPLLEPGGNRGSLGTAGRAALLVDGESYFSALEAALRNARRSIFIIGWDFDARISLTPQRPGSPTLGALLRECVENQPELQLNILVWSISVVHGPSAMLPNLIGAGWEDHPRIRFKLDDHHPLYGAHHQKIVCIDGVIAFVGGMDLTLRRWDQRGHAIPCAHRIDVDGKPYPPVHDVQMLVDGEAATALCRLAHDRWRNAIGEDLSSADAPFPDDPWPSARS